MTTLRVPQSSTIAVTGGIGNLRVSQFALVNANANGPSLLRVAQLAIIHVVANGKNYLPLGPVLRLPCWQPCTAYGTRSIVIRLK